MAKNTSKLYIEFPPDKSVESYSIFTSIFPNLKPLPIPNSNAFIVKLDSSFDNETIINQLRIKHPDWIVQIKSDQNGVQCNLNYHVAETAQRQSGLFQLRIPDSGVLPVAPATLAKIHSFSPCLQYSVSSLQQQQQHPNSSLNFSSIPTPQIMNRLYEDWYEDGHEESFQDVNLAREELDKKLVPSLGEWEGDVFLGRLDNQKVTIKNLLEFTSEFGTVQFLRLCNRSIIREDRSNNKHTSTLFKIFFILSVPVDSTAFVRFEESSSAKEFIENVNGSTWLGRIVKCEKCWSWSLSAERRGMTPPISMTVKKENQ